MDPVLISKVEIGRQTRAIWLLEGWGLTTNFDILQTQARCSVEVDIREKENEPEPEDPTQLTFYFKPHMSSQTQWLSLWVSGSRYYGSKILHYDINVDILGEKMELLGESVKTSAGPGSINVAGMVLKKEFIKCHETAYGSQTVSPRPRDLRIRLSVTPHFVHNRNQNDGVLVEKEEKAVVKGGVETIVVATALSQNLKGMFGAEENFSDLELEMKDNMTLSAHRFILAARSPVLRALIEREVKKEGFNGTIKLPEVNAKPMVVILEWMYSGELSENAGAAGVGNVMEEVVDAAVKFQLGELIKLLDTTLISICTPGNMFQLYQVAQKHGMKVAVEDLSIKEHV